jgi:hypothetical protein
MENSLRQKKSTSAAKSRTDFDGLNGTSETRALPGLAPIRFFRSPLDSNHTTQLLHRCGTLLQRGLLFRSELDLNDLLDSLCP